MRSIRQSQQGGFASIVVALILVLVFSLIALSFATIARREQQNSLNQQLSLQASYTAESAINKIVSQVKANAPNMDTASSNCADNTYLNNNGLNKIGGSAGNTSVTCIKVKTTPGSIKTTSTPASESKSIYLESTDGSAITSIPFSWSASCDASDTTCTNKNTNFANNTNNYSSPAWSYPPVMQLSITPLNSYHRSDLISKTFSVFLYPSKTGSNDVNAGPATNASKVQVMCDKTKSMPCTVNINIPSTFSQSNRYILKYIPIYGDANTETFIKTQSGGSLTQKIKNSQVVIDITAKSQDIVRRIKVAVPTVNANLTQTSSGSTVPDYALQAAVICKRMKTNASETVFVKAISTDSTDSCDNLKDTPIVWQ
jgi:Tfp pilus assembly protein PilV